MSFIFIICILCLSGCGNIYKITKHPIVIRYGMEEVIINKNKAHAWQVSLMAEEYCNTLGQSADLLSEDRKTAIYSCINKAKKFSNTKFRGQSTR